MHLKFQLILQAQRNHNPLDTKQGVGKLFDKLVPCAWSTATIMGHGDDTLREFLGAVHKPFISTALQAGRVLEQVRIFTIHDVLISFVGCRPGQAN